MKLAKYSLVMLMSLFLFACGNDDNAYFEKLSDKEIYVGDTIDLLDGIKAFDHDGTDISDHISVDSTLDVSKPGDYIITYQVKGENKKVVSHKRTITVISKAPVFIDSKRMIEIELGDEINLKICLSAYDDVDHDITSFIKVIDTGGFNKDVSGSYIITYEVVDSQGQKATHKRTIVVNEAITY